MMKSPKYKIKLQKASPLILTLKNKHQKTKLQSDLEQKQHMKNQHFRTIESILMISRKSSSAKSIKY